MPDQDRSSGSGGISSGGDMQINAGGDVVGRDKVTTTTTTTTTNSAGFKDQANKDEFVAQLDELRDALRDIRSQIAGVEQLDEDAKEELEAEILQQVQALKDSRQQAEQIDVGQPPAGDTIELVKATLAETEGFLGKITKIGETATEFSTDVAPIVARALPLLASATRFFGL